MFGIGIFKLVQRAIAMLLQDGLHDHIRLPIDLVAPGGRNLEWRLCQPLVREAIKVFRRHHKITTDVRLWKAGSHPPPAFWEHVLEQKTNHGVELSKAGLFTFERGNMPRKDGITASLDP